MKYRSKDRESLEDLSAGSGPRGRDTDKGYQLITNKSYSVHFHPPPGVVLTVDNLLVSETTWRQLERFGV